MKVSSTRICEKHGGDVVRRLTPLGKAIALTMYTLAFGLLCVSVVQYGLPMRYLPAWATLAALHAVAMFYPIHIPTQKANHSFGEMFCYAGFFLLPPSWAILVCYARVPADMYRRSREKRPHTWLPPLWNASMITVLCYAVIRILDHYGAKPPTLPEHWAALMAAAVGFEVGQILLVHTFVSLYERKPWKTLGLTITPEGFTVDVLQAYLGAVLAIWWYDASLAIPLTALVAVGLFRIIQLGNQAAESNLDPKTQLHNARYLERQLTVAIDKSLKKGWPVSLVFADLDYLREVNNTYGHLIGDLALTTVATVLRKPTLPGYVASRFGGEEFILLLPGVAKNDAILLAEQLRRTLEATPCTPPAGDKLTVTMSLGVATCAEDGRTNYDLIRAADHAMYHAKAAGRNRVAWAGEGQLVAGRPDSPAETSVAES